MTPNETQQTDAFAELELPPPGDLPTVDAERGRPSWEPDDGDFD